MACANFRISHRREPALSLPKGAEDTEGEFKIKNLCVLWAAAVNPAFPSYGCGFAALGSRAGDLTLKLAQLILNDDLPGGIGINGSQRNEIWRPLFADLCS